jgi:uncharacterized RDD family membrane protein YckC
MASNPPALTPAGYGPRFVASLLDGLILITLTFPLLAITGENSPLGLIVLFVVNLAYYAISHSSDWQATPGKHLMKIYVVDEAGGRLSRRRALERALAHFLPSLPIYSSLAQETAATLALWASLVWFVPILFTAARTGVHDILCHTRVVSGEPIP